MTRISCEQQDIAFFRFSPVIGKDVGTTERDNHKLCDIIIRYPQSISLILEAMILVLTLILLSKQD